MSTNAWLILGLASGIHGRQVDSLLATFGSVDAIVDADVAQLLHGGMRQRAAGQIDIPDEQALARCHDWLETGAGELLTWSDSRYPPLLRNIYDPPVLLYVRGDVDVLSLPQLAIVGSRNATPGGCDTARRFAAHLGGAGFSIASGLAVGIDAAAHRGALDAGAHTVAVCATGPDEVYPSRHRRLAEEIVAHGAIVTEFPPGTSPRREQFPQRNRLISGMSAGTLVVEAGLRSGALITARCASEQGREVFAVPGSIHNPTARGCHRLIRTGAKLVESSHDIMEELPGILAGMSELVEQNDAGGVAETPYAPDPEYQQLLALMGWDPVTVDTLVNRSGLTTEQVSSMLLILELEGRVQPLVGGRYTQREEGPRK